jgi:phage-related protein
MTEFGPLKPVLWIASSQKDYRAFPPAVQQDMGFALFRAQQGRKHPNAKPLKGFGGAGVVEIVADHRGDTFRCIYTVRYAHAVYVVHVFQKKSKRGVKTPKAEIDIIHARLRELDKRMKENA